ncbi:thioredoxin domain-containing protein [Photobacterium kishitanii]|nr:thioredoxin domain-containing protein [Photobacterium kishitanii]
MTTKFVSKIIIGTLAIISLGAAGKFILDQRSQQKVFVPKEGVNYTIIDTSSARKQLTKLGIGNNDSFEFFSYSCGHCYALSKNMRTLEIKTGVNIKQLALNFNTLPLAQMHYTLTHTTGKQAVGFQRQLFKIAENWNINDQTKLEKISELPATYGIKTDDVRSLSLKADDYSNLVNIAFNNLSLQYTPTLIIKGKYLIKNDSLKSMPQMEKLISHLNGLPTKNQP